jgi:uncharacterized protein
VPAVRDLGFSKFNIVVNSKLNNTCIALHGLTGKLLVLDKHIGTLLRDRDDRIFAESEQALSKLLANGFLLTSVIDESETCRRLAELMHKNATKKCSLTIAPTLNCNYCCPYCFERASGVSSDKSSSCISKACINLLFAAFDRGDIDLSSTIRLFGGEPLLRKNYETIAYIIECGRQRGMRFSITTNGYELGLFNDLLTKETVTQIEVTVDGLEARHNAARIHKLYYPTFRRTISNINDYIQNGIKIVVRTNVGKLDKDELGGLVDLYSSLGWLNSDCFNYYFSPIERCHAGDFSSGLGPVELYEHLLEHQICEKSEKHVSIYGRISNMLDSLITNKQMILFGAEGCTANRFGLILDPSGTLYACEAYLGGSSQICGRVTENGIETNENFEKWNKRYIVNMPCRSCAYALYCGGGCSVCKEEKDFFVGRCGEYKTIFNTCLSLIEM